jgi:SAM-dependent methyltransferase
MPVFETGAFNHSATCPTLRKLVEREGGSTGAAWELPCVFSRSLGVLTFLLLYRLWGYLRRTRLAVVAPTTLALALAVSLVPTTRARAQAALPSDSFPAPSRPVSAIVAPRYIAEDRRDAFGEAEAVIRRLGIRRGLVVADIGAGDGYYVARLAPRLGPAGKVLAVDIEPKYLAELRQRVAKAGWTNVEVIEGAPHDPRLPANGVDVAILIHMYHEIEQPFGLLYHLALAMKPRGLVGIVDLDGPTDQHGTPPGLLRCEVEALGFRRIRLEQLSDGSYLATFRAPDAGDRLTTAAQVRARLAAAPCVTPGAP